MLALSLQGLLDVTCKTVANMIKGKTPEEIRKTFNIKNDFTPAEEEQVSNKLYLIFIPSSLELVLKIVVYFRCGKRMSGVRKSNWLRRLYLYFYRVFLSISP